MGFLCYILKAALWLALMHTLWRLLLARETFHRFNRYLLVGVAVLSCILPACVLTLHRTVGVERVGEALAVILPDDAPEPAAAGPVPVPAWPQLLWMLYAAGAAVVLLHWLRGAVQAFRLLHTGERVRLADGTRIVLSDRSPVPFSWLHRIVLPRAAWERGCAEVISHERAHIRAAHAEENLLLELLTAFQWFNPWIWALRSDLRALHEYEADAAVLAENFDRKAYQLSLISQVAAERGLSAGIPFRGEPLRSRLAMMQRRRSPGVRALRALYVVPVVALSLLASARTQTDFNYAAAVPAEEGPGAVLQPVVPWAELDVKPGVSFRASDPGSIARELVIQSYDLHELDDLEGLVPVRVVITASGRIGDIRILTDRLREGQEAAIRTLLGRYNEGMPGIKDGCAVATEVLLPLDFGWR